MKQMRFDFEVATEPSPGALVAAQSAVIEEALTSEPPCRVSLVEPLAQTPEGVAGRATLELTEPEPGPSPAPEATVLWPAKFYQTSLVPIAAENLDVETTVILERGSKGFKLVPLSRSAATKLMLMERRFTTDDKHTLNKALSFAVVSNINLPMNDHHPVAKMLSQYGLGLVLARPALATLRRLRREFKRVMVPFKFHVPPQFKDLQNNESDYVTGPFVGDVYSSEITQYTKRLEKLGLIGKPDFGLYGYQGEDVPLLAVKRWAFINHNMGLGKTLIASALMQMHGYERILVIAPAAAIGSFQSGWRHELKRMGIPEDHIHIVDGPEDLPADDITPSRKAGELWKPFAQPPHVYLIDYNTLAKEKWAHTAFDCPGCLTINEAGTHKGRCTGCGKEPNICPRCYSAFCVSTGTQPKPDDPAVEELKKEWNGRRCSACQYVIKHRVPTAGRVSRAEMLMGHVLKRNLYGKTKNLTPEQHQAVDGLSTYDKLQQFTPLASLELRRQVRGLLSPKPVWKHIPSGMFKFLLLDESHMVKDNSTRRGNAVQMIRGVKRVYIMTGTMLTNYVSDSFWQLQRVFPGGLFPVGKQLLDFSAWKGQKQGEEIFLNKFEGRSRRTSGRRIASICEPGVFWGLMACVQLRRHDDDPEVNAQVQMPPVKFETEFIEMDPHHRDLYRMKTGDFQKDVLKKIIEARGAEYADKLTVEDLAPLQPAELRTRLQDLRQIASCPDQTGLYNAKGAQIKVTTKDARILELVSTAAANKEKTVVFCSWSAQITRLKMLFDDQKIPTMILDGKCSRHTKWDLIDQWRTLPDDMVLLAAVESMGQAINLTSLVPEEFRCHQVIFGSPEWSPNKMQQAWCRVYRIGQTQETKVHFLYHKDTIEEEMDDLLYQKRVTIAKAQDRVEISRDDNISVLTYQEIAARILNKYSEGR